MSDTVTAVDRYIAEHLPEFIDDLRRLVRVPSVAATGEAMEEAATLVAELLGGAGLTSTIMASDGFPLVYADSGTSSTRTLICYNHYDVQPPEPLALWESPPFAPEEHNGRLYGRGVSDDKGQLLARIAAVRAVRAVTGGLPARVKFLVEGEEEIGSGSLPGFIARHQALLAADACVWENGGVDAVGRPTVILGKRGVLCVELRVRTLTRDAHSGQAHNLPNAAWRLVGALSTLRDVHEHIRIAGFYDAVRPPTAVERQLLERMPSDEAFAREHYGVAAFVEDHTGWEYVAAVYQPTANLAGIGAGWQGSGSKTVIPATATAKLDFRLVPKQDPHDILAKLRRHLDTEGYSDVEVVQLGGAEPAATTPANDPFVRLTARTAAQVYGKPAVLVPLTGGSGPLHTFRAVLKTPIVTLGTADPYVNLHAPNESLSLAQFTLGTRHMARLLLAFGAAQP
ncbi:MAG: M20/M25/M40 family metallo-hydrolase [Ktedonobacterales bacterium]